MAVSARRSLRAVDWWVDGVGRFAGILTVVLPVLIVLVLLVLGTLVDELCLDEDVLGDARYDDGCVTSLTIGFGIPTMAAVLVFLLAAITWSAFLSRWRRRRRYHQEYHPRAQAVKDWYAQGRVTKAEFEAVHGRLAAVAAGTMPGERLWTAAQILLRLAFVVLVAAAAAWAAAAQYAAWDGNYNDYAAIIGTLSVIAFVLSVVGVLLLVLAVGARRVARRQLARDISDAETAERDLLDKSHERAGEA